MTKKSGDDRFLPTAQGWGTKHLVPDKVRSLLAKEERPPTNKEPRVRNDPYWSSLSLSLITIAIGRQDFTT
jgi:hypothetical protein